MGGQIGYRGGAAIALLAVLMITGSPVAAEQIGPGHRAYQVLQRLESRRNEIKEWSKAAKQADEVQSTVNDFNIVAQPMIPMLEGIGKSSILDALGELPFVGKPFAIVKKSSAALAELMKLMAWTQKLDEQYKKPIRQAIFASERFIDSKDTDDLRKLIESYKRAIPAMEHQRDSIASSRTRIAAMARLAKKLSALSKHMSQSGPQLGGSSKSLSESLTEMDSALGLMQKQTEDILSFMREVVSLDESSSSGITEQPEDAASATKSSNPRTSSPESAATGSADSKEPGITASVDVIIVIPSNDGYEEPARQVAKIMRDKCSISSSIVRDSDVTRSQLSRSQVIALGSPSNNSVIRQTVGVAPYHKGYMVARGWGPAFVSFAFPVTATLTQATELFCLVEAASTNWGASSVQSIDGAFGPASKLVILGGNDLRTVRQSVSNFVSHVRDSRRVLVDGVALVGMASNSPASNDTILIALMVFMAAALVACTIWIAVARSRKPRETIALTVGWLHIRDSEEQRRVALRSDGLPVLLGRSARADVVLRDSSVSAEHARIDISGGEVWIVDLDSRNGTFVNGKKVSSCQCAEGDEIKLGRARMVYYATEGAPLSG